MPREIALLTNPTSGRGTGERTAALALPRLTEAGFRVRRLQGHDEHEARDLASRAVEDGVEALVVVGGDGLVNLAVQLLAHRQTCLGIIPAGHGNDAARSLGLPRTDPEAAADVVIGGRVRTVDLGLAGSTYFLSVLSAGFDAVVSERAQAMRWPSGGMRYAVATLAEMRGFTPLDYHLVLDGEPRDLPAMLVAVGNGPTFGGGLRVTEGALLDDGLLDVVLFHPVSKADLLRTYPRLFRGTHVTHRAYEHHRVSQVTIDAPGVVAYADGERVGPLPVTVTVAPRALRVLVGPA